MMVDASFWTCMGFIVLVVSMGRRAWQLFTATVDRRISHIRYALEEAARLREDALTLLASCRRQQADTLVQVQAILQHAADEAARLKKQAAQAMQDYIAVEEYLLQERLHMMERQALEQLRAQVIDIALKAAEKIIYDSLTPEQEKKLFETALNRLSVM
jgi:F-type H+-transporting ATPase subunit b